MTTYESRIIDFSTIAVVISAILHGRIGYDLACTLVAVVFALVGVYCAIKIRLRDSDR